MTLQPLPSLVPPITEDHRSSSARVGVLGTYPPARNGLATFSAALCKGLEERGAHVSAADVGSAPACVEQLNRGDVAIIGHDDDVYGGVDGDEVVDIVGGLRVPSIVVTHTVPEKPTRRQRFLLASITTKADHVVVMSDVAKLRLCGDYGVDRRKVTMIPHGANVPSGPTQRRPSRPTILTWGLLRPGKGIERVIDVMPSLKDLPGRPRYLVAGPTDPKVLAADGEAYRDARVEQARRAGVADSVSLDGRYWNESMLTALAQSATIVVVPYDSTDQVTSGVLCEAVACGRPVVATAFPYAVELLRGGAGIVVGHDDADALAAALRRILTQPRVAGAMAAEARLLAPDMAWPVVAAAYLRVAQRVIADRRVRSH